jgi:formate/nitrite transporter
MSNRSTSRPAAAATEALQPADIAQRVEVVSVQRAALSTRRLIVLGLLGGIYIGFGGALATLALTDNGLGFGLARLTAGVAFSLGLILLVIAGGELFTGNNLMILAVASRKVSARSMWRNWILVYAANAAGAFLLAIAIHHTGILDGGGIRVTAARVAETKAELGLLPAFLRGVLCNILVCLAVWLSAAARSVVGKVIAIVFPIAAFVALGFEHCIANLYLLPIGMLSDANVTLADFFGNIVPVTLGNTVGGVGVGAAYWFIYGSDRPLVGLHPQERCADPADVQPVLRRAAKEVV